MIIALDNLNLKLLNLYYIVNLGNISTVNIVSIFQVHVIGCVTDVFLFNSFVLWHGNLPVKKTLFLKQPVSPVFFAGKAP